MKFWMRRTAPVVIVAMAALAITACDETLEGGLGCGAGALCPEKPAALVQDTLSAVVFDTSLSGFPPTGSESQLLLSVRGDTLDARAILRFDSLPHTFRYPGQPADSAIERVDSATIRLRVVAADTMGPPITIELYDVDTVAANDTAAATLLPLFTPERLLGSRTFDSTALKDTLIIPVSDSAVLAAILSETGDRLRIGVRITSPRPAELRVLSSNGANFGIDAPRLTFRVSPDTLVRPIVTIVRPVTPEQLASDLADFQILAIEPPPAPPEVLRIGGVPGRRAYIRFDIPARIIDSSTVVRAQLLLTQRPNTGGATAGDTASLQPFAIATGAALTDIRRILSLLAIGFASTVVVPQDSAVVSVELREVLRGWRGTSPERTPRAIAILAKSEGSSPWQADFFSIEAPAAVRPRLVITYVPQPEPRIP